MKTKLVKIGNSKCVRIPSAMIKACGINEDVKIDVKNGSILITSLKPCRKNWDLKFSKLNTKDSDVIPEFNNKFDDEEWTW